MEGGFPLLFTPNNDTPYSSSTSLNPSISMLPPPLLNQTTEASQVDSDIDWLSLLSSSIKDGTNQYLPSPSVSQTAVNGDGGNKFQDNGKVIKRTRRVIPPRIAFHTKSPDHDILDDGYKWRKYGQKAVKNSSHPRSYYHCIHHTCNVKKQIQRLSKDPSIVVTTYEGIHNHPCEKLLESLSPLLKQMQFLPTFLTRPINVKDT